MPRLAVACHEMTQLLVSGSGGLCTNVALKSLRESNQGPRGNFFSLPCSPSTTSAYLRTLRSKRRYQVTAMQPPPCCSLEMAAVDFKGAAKTTQLWYQDQCRIMQVQWPVGHVHTPQMLHPSCGTAGAGHLTVNSGPLLHASQLTEFTRNCITGVDCRWVLYTAILVLIWTLTFLQRMQYLTYTTQVENCRGLLANM